MGDKRSGAAPATGETLTPEQRERFSDLLELVAREQDKQAYSEIFAYYGPRVKSYLLRLGSDDAAAEEIAQDVMVTVWRKANLFDRKQASVSTWIFRIARNRRIDVFRRTQKPPLDPEEPMVLPSAAPAPESVVEAQDTESQVREAMAALPAEQLELIKLAFYEGLSHREIADRLDLPLGTVKSRIRLAFARMRGNLDEE